MNARRILITGALGHIGSRLIHDIRPGDFDEIRLVDDLSTQRYASLFELPTGVPFRFHEASVLDAGFERFVDGVDAVIHLAAITNAAASFDVQSEVERVNLVGTERVATAAAKAGARFLLVSTTSVYGTAEAVVDEACPESDLRPQSPYAQSKLRAERSVASLGGTHGLRSVSCRFGTIYGISRGMRFHTAINKFCWQACAGIPITVWRTAWDQKRPYLDLGDAVAAIRFILERDLFDGEVYNVLTDNATVGQVVEAIRELVPDLAVELVDSRIMNQLSYEVAREKFCSRGFTFRGDMARGIRDTVQLLRGVRPGAVA